MNYSSTLMQRLSENHLLKHPFYQSWSSGELPLSTLRDYAKQYYHHVSAFPRYISATHSNCEDINARQVLLDNLMDEERGENHHPELWLRFAEGLGATREEVKNEELLPETAELISTFKNYSKSSYEQGLGALFAYEHQVPEVAKSKLDGLQRFYGIADSRSTDFFTVHFKADVYHTQALESLLNQLTPAEKERAEEAAVSASRALWKFLDGMQRVNGAGMGCC